MHHILFDCETMKYANTGLYEYCKQFGHALLRNKAEDEKITYYVPSGLKGFFGEEHQYITISKLHRLMMPSFSYLDIWHTSFQSTHYRPSNKNIGHVLTIHDLNFIHEKKNPKKVASVLKKVQRNIDSADHVVTISKFVLEDVKQHLDLRNKPASVIYNGGVLETFPGFDTPEYRPQRPFIYNIGSIDAKKNAHVLPALLIGNEYELVIAGPVFDEEYKRKILGTAAQYGVEDRVKVIGSISNKSRYWYYHHCTAFAFPSLAEGFGLPVVEAMSEGKPCFLSDRTSLPEVGGPLAYYFHDFTDTAMQKTFAEGMAHFNATMPGAAMKAHAASLNLDNTARNYLQIYRSLY
ncbi:glycosyltransferase family 4 protein [Chitinophaga pinensis]|uniref:Glycosyl transferase group 1 n=1 Tax=Chitinophaga pinensis (strain ATCC 43595 / DSM 2588 / LMG 13176 / NBRC 15968 / NCIMB 11800 / UQM 2034) TaxID=485918 RepID=A0A979FZM4_CHIPD|nr:glycosyltransferase family 1 protein [Chitinophaga pinensis]ACU58007.1 glycosyl transferase group 1 [Chitinophaga pinensis DSM 2588]